MDEAEIQRRIAEQDRSPIVYKARSLVAGLDVKVIDDEARVLRFVISTEQRDRDGDIVRQRGIDLTNYQKNPVVFYGHNSWGYPIARSIKVKKEKIGDVMSTWADALFAGMEKQGHAEAELCFALARDGFINAASIGFMRRATKPLGDSMLTEEEQARRDAGGYVWGSDILTSELYEWSPVGIPSNVGSAVIERAAKAGLAPVDRTVADFIDLARAKGVQGAALDAFRRSLLGNEREVICVGCFPTEKAPERIRPLIVEAAEEIFESDGFDLWQQSLGKACPSESVSAKAAPEPDPEETVAPVTRAAPQADEIAQLRARLAALEAKAVPACGCSKVAPVDVGALVKAAVADALGPVVAEIRESHKALGARIEDTASTFYVDSLKAVDAARAETKSKSTASREARANPVVRAEDAPPPAVPVTKQTTTIDTKALVAPILKSLLPEIRGMAREVMKESIYEERGGITAEQLGV